MDLVFTGMPGESYRRRLGSLLLCLWYVFGALTNTVTNSPVCSFCTSALGLVLFQIFFNLSVFAVMEWPAGAETD